MAMPVQVLFSDVAAGTDGDALYLRCREAGIVEAIDLAMVDDSMHDDILGEDVHLLDSTCFIVAWYARKL